MFFKYLILIAFSFSISNSVNLKEEDKKKHSSYTGVISIVINNYLHIQENLPLKERILKTIIYSNIPGVLKEISDSRDRDNSLSKEDLYANFIGSITGTLLSEYSNNLLSVSLGEDYFTINTNFKF